MTQLTIGMRGTSLVGSAVLCALHVLSHWSLTILHGRIRVISTYQWGNLGSNWVVAQRLTEVNSLVRDLHPGLFGSQSPYSQPWFNSSEMTIKCDGRGAAGSFLKTVGEEEITRRLDTHKEMHFHEVGESGLLKLDISLSFILCQGWMPCLKKKKKA